jgi:hypothetical protein
MCKKDEMRWNDRFIRLSPPSTTPSMLFLDQFQPHIFTIGPIRYGTF